MGATGFQQATKKKPQNSLQVPQIGPQTGQQTLPQNPIEMFDYNKGKHEFKTWKK